MQVLPAQAAEEDEQQGVEEREELVGEPVGPQKRVVVEGPFAVTSVHSFRVGSSSRAVGHGSSA